MDILNKIVAHQVANQTEAMMESVSEHFHRSKILAELAATEAGVEMLNVEALIELQHSWLDMMDKLIKTFEKPGDDTDPAVSKLRNLCLDRLEELRSDLPVRGNDAL